MVDSPDTYSVADDRDLDAGIKPFVVILREAGIETFESCEGGAGHAYQYPTIKFHGHRDAGWLALHAAQVRGLPVMALQRSWMIIDGEPVGPHWEMVFYEHAGAH